MTFAISMMEGDDSHHLAGGQQFPYVLLVEQAAKVFDRARGPHAIALSRLSRLQCDVSPFASAVASPNLKNNQ
jgi:hypothetical protein